MDQEIELCTIGTESCVRSDNNEQATDEVIAEIINKLSLIKLGQNSSQSEFNRLKSRGLIDIALVPEEERPNILQRWLFLETDKNMRAGYIEEFLNEVEDNRQVSQSNMEIEELESSCSMQTSMESSLSDSYLAENILNQSRMTPDFAAKSGNSNVISITRESFLSLRSKLEAQFNVVL